jgi:hypothetical protein
LLVENNRGWRDWCKAILIDAQVHEIDEAGSFVSAQTCLGREKYDLAIIDLRLATSDEANIDNLDGALLLDELDSRGLNTVILSGKLTRELNEFIKNNYPSVIRTFDKAEFNREQGNAPFRAAVEKAKHKPGEPHRLPPARAARRTRELQEKLEKAKGRKPSGSFTSLNDAPSGDAGARFSWDAFICYATPDQDEVSPLVATLRAAGLSLWLDSEQVRPGDNFIAKIQEGLRGSRRLLPLIGKHFTGSKWCEMEYTAAMTVEDMTRTKRCLIPVLLESGAAASVPPLMQPLRRIEVGASHSIDELCGELLRARLE